MTKKVTDITSRMSKIQKINANMPQAPEWVQKGFDIMSRMPSEDQSAIIQYIFGLILSDVETGLRGEDAETFFQEIDALYEKSEQDKENNAKTCFFCDEEVDAGVCLGCLMKLARGDDIRGKGIIKGLIDEIRDKSKGTSSGENDAGRL